MPITMIGNPNAMGCTPERLDAMQRLLRGAASIEFVSTASRGHATKLCREASERGESLVIVAGGDGTLNEAANGLAGGQTALAPIPAGCTNVFARSLGLPNDPIEATSRLAGALARPRLRAVDLGSINGRRFLFTSAVGFTAEVVKRMHDQTTSRPRIRQSWFLAQAVSAAHSYRGRPPTMRLSAGGASFQGVGMVAQNARALTFMGNREVNLARGAGLDTGSLSVSILRKVGLETLATLPAMIIAPGHRATLHPHIENLSSVTALDVEALGEPLHAEVDGDYIGAFERIEFGAHPGELSVLVP
ncbi:hypothetical protein HJD18_03070 [Thermoleophilia bacterium SCSIO 60948]|nr:hypothetical protein HJD18_03070 [Thermoleophilia bacterium SCSIO 60948]